jgi:glutathione S-transferase
MKLFWCPRTRSSRVVWLLEEAGVDYELVLTDVRNPESTSAEFRAASPMRKVPALEDGEVRMADSAAICLYLADRYASGRLAPALEEADRGRFLYWMFFTPGAIEPAMAQKMGGWTTDSGAIGWGNFERTMGTWERGLEPGPWLLGDRFSAADVMAGSSAYFMRLFGVLPEGSPLNAYADRCLERPAYQRALALDAEGVG